MFLYTHHSEESSVTNLTLGNYSDLDVATNEQHILTNITIYNKGKTLIIQKRKVQEGCI